MDDKILTDEQMGFLIKAALEFNANIIAMASIIYGGDVSIKTKKAVSKNIQQTAKVYNKQIDSIITGQYKEAK